MSPSISSLDYENDILKQVSEEDCLCVVSKGIGLERLMIKIILAYTEPEHIVFVIGSETDLETYLIRYMEILGIPTNRLPRVVNSGVSISAREKMYLEGGVLFISSTILVMDLLVDRVPVENVAGIIVCDAHKILETNQDSFILRLYRMKNKGGFIKAFSQTPSALTRGFGTVDRVMRALFINQIFLWPRHHPDVCKSLDTRAKPEVIEMRFTLTPLMESIQFAVMDLINMSLKEMKEANSSYLCDADELTVENALTPNFSRLLRRQFEPIWNQLNYRTKRLISDIKLLRQVLFSLTDDDCVTFFCLVESIRQSVKLDSQVADWIFWEPAETLFAASKERLLKGSSLDSKDVDLEMNPKWTAFCETIEEIRKGVKESDPLKPVSATTVLVLVREEGTIKKLNDVLEKGPEFTLSELYAKTEFVMRAKNIQPRDMETKDNLNNKRMKVADLDKNVMSMSAIMEEFNEFRDKGVNDDLEILYHCPSYGYAKVDEILYSKVPWFVIMYDPDVEFIRRLEVYQATKCAPDKCKIYFFMFDASAEEQRYLTNLRKEKEAFESLIREKATMTQIAERDGKSGNHPDLERSLDLKLTGGRNAGISRRNIINQRIVVDMREFRSELPPLIHRRGIDIIPVTIEIGDYILAPDTCVERKSLSDLIGSLNSGRLYTQCSVMTRHYKRSILLVEFDESRPFNLRGKIGFGFIDRKVKTTVDAYDSLPKLILLTITFPQLSVIWSPSPTFSAEMFEYLKIDREQPNADQALRMSEEQLPVETNVDKYDLETKEFLLCLPGVNFHNVYRLMSKCLCILDLLKKSQQELTGILESETNSKVLYEALHSNLVTTCVNDELKMKKKTFDSKSRKKKIK